MVIVLLGAFLFIVGILYIVVQPLRGRLSRVRPVESPRNGNTLEPASPASGFSFRSTWPGLVMLAVGSILLLIGGAF